MSWCWRLHVYHNLQSWRYYTVSGIINIFCLPVGVYSFFSSLMKTRNIFIQQDRCILYQYRLYHYSVSIFCIIILYQYRLYRFCNSIGAFNIVYNLFNVKQSRFFNCSICENGVRKFYTLAEYSKTYLNQMNLN